MDNNMRDMLVTTFNLQDASPEKQDELIQKIGGMIFQSVILRVAPGMSPQVQDQFEKLLATDTSPEDLMEFLNKEVPNFDAIVAEEAKNLKAERDAIMDQVKG
jgi:hypothetical protein